jgi:hypothetical protein
MEREGIDEERAMARVLDLGLKELRCGALQARGVTIREAAAILGQI